MAIKEYPTGRIPSVFGQSGNYLTTDGNTISWGTAATPANLTLLNGNGTSLSGSTTTVSGISNRNNLFIYVTSGSNTGGGNILFTLNGDTRSVYNRVNLRQDGANAPTWQFSTGAANIDLCQAGANVDTFNTMIWIAGCATTGVKVGNYISYVTSQGTGRDIKWGQFMYPGTSAISSVSIASQSGTFDAGTLFVYGG